MASAFFLRTKTKERNKPEEYLSVNWLNYYKGIMKEQFKKYFRIMNNKGFFIKEEGRLAVLNVKKTVDHVRNSTSEKRILKFKHITSHIRNQKDPTHTGIFGYTIGENHIAFLIKDSINGIYKKENEEPVKIK